MPPINQSRRDLLDILDLEAGSRRLTRNDKKRLLDAIYEAMESAVQWSPTNLEVLVCEDCNLRCDYCFMETKNPKTMTLEIGKQMVDFLLRACGDNKHLNLQFFGGEPLMVFPTMHAVVEYANRAVADSERQISYSMTTNGTLFTEEILDFCKVHNISTLISLDGLPDVHDAHRKTCSGAGSYALVERNLPLIFKYLSKPQVRVTPYPDTTGNLSAGIQHLLSLGFDNFIIGAAHGVEWSAAEHELFDCEMRQVIEMAFADSTRTPKFNVQTISGPEIQCGWGCRAGKAYLCVGADGRLGNCSLIMGTPGLGDHYILGDVWDGLTREPLRAEFNVIQAHRMQECLQCDVATWCCGGCPGTNYKMTGSILRPSLATCREVRYQLAHQKLWQELGCKDDEQATN